MPTRSYRLGSYPEEAHVTTKTPAEWRTLISEHIDAVGKMLPADWASNDVYFLPTSRPAKLTDAKAWRAWFGGSGIYPNANIHGKNQQWSQGECVILAIAHKKTASSELSNRAGVSELEIVKALEEEYRKMYKVYFSGESNRSQQSLRSQGLIRATTGAEEKKDTSLAETKRKIADLQQEKDQAEREHRERTEQQQKDFNERQEAQQKEHREVQEELNRQIAVMQILQKRMEATQTGLEESARRVEPQIATLKRKVERLEADKTTISDYASNLLAQQASFLATQVQVAEESPALNDILRKV